MEKKVIAILFLMTSFLNGGDFELGMVELQSKHTATAIEYFEKALQNGNYKAAYRLGAIAEASGDNKKAIEYYKIAAVWGDLFKNKKLQTFQQSSVSMSGTIEKGEDILSIRSNNIVRGDLIVFVSPEDKKTFFVDRCIATEGDEILYQENHLYVHFKEGDTFIKVNYPQEKIKFLANKLWVDNPFMGKIKGIHYDNANNVFDAMAARVANNNLAMSPIETNLLPENKQYPFNVLFYQVPKESCFVVGDNRSSSLDSRFFGAISLKGEIYKPLAVLFSDTKERRGMEIK